MLWGMSFVWSTIVFRYYSPVTTVFLRLILSFILLYSGGRLFGKFKSIEKKDYRLFLLSALFNPFLYFLGESYGLKMSSSTMSAVIIATIPLFTPVVAYFTLKESLTRLNIIGMIISFAGILLMVFDSNLQLTASPAGIILLLFAVATAISYTIFLKKLSSKYSALNIITVQNLIGAVYFLPLFLVFDLGNFLSVKPDAKLMGSLLSLAVLCSSVAYIFFTVSVREIGVSRSNLFSNLIPVFTAVFSFFLLDEHFNLQKISGMAIVIFGVYLSQIGKSSPLVNYG
jgi:drug/metabolite transporter (DMT)-like permease